MADRFDLILFDADDTLFDFATSEAEVFGTCLRTFAPDVDPAAAYAAYQAVSLPLWRAVEAGTLLPAEMREQRWMDLSLRLGVSLPVQTISCTFIDLLAQTTHLVEGADEVCAALARDHKLGIVTNGFEAVQVSRLRRSELAPHIDFLVTSEAAGASKPSARPFLRALELHGRPVAPEHVLMVGDSLTSDIEGGRRMGFATCWFNAGSRAPATETDPDHVVEALAELLALV